MVIAWVLFLVASWFWYKANTLLSEKTSVGLFKSGGFLIFIGFVLGMIPSIIGALAALIWGVRLTVALIVSFISIIGALVALIGWVRLTVAWFRVKEAQE